MTGRFDRQDYQGKALEEIITDPNEPVFVIRGQDTVSGPAVRAWADLAEHAGADPDILQSARDHSYRMDDWRPKSVPDMPKKKVDPGDAVD